MDDERLIEEGLTGRLGPESAEFERFVDVTARRPSGSSLELRPDDRYVELCFGGGQVLRRALETVATAAGIDHSPDMLALAARAHSRRPLRPRHGGP